MTKPSRELVELMQGPKRGRGRPAFVPAPDFDSAMAALKPAEGDFVRHVLAGASQEAAYGKAYPDGARTEGGRRHQGTKLAKRHRVAHALTLAKQAGALQAITGIRYDVQSAHQELCDRIEAADKVGQHNAVASLMKLKMALHKLDQPTAHAVQGVQIVLQTADGEVVRQFGAVREAQAEVVVQQSDEGEAFDGN